MVVRVLCGCMHVFMYVCVRWGAGSQDVCVCRYMCVCMNVRACVKNLLLPKSELLLFFYECETNAQMEIHVVTVLLI
jgi:hypothetical protein